MLSGKSMYYNSIKADNAISDSCVTIANGPKPTTVLGKRFIFTFPNHFPLVLSTSRHFDNLIYSISMLK